MIPAGNRNPLVFGTFVLLFFGAGFMYLNKHFNIVGLFKKKPKAKRGPAPKTVTIQKTQKKKAAAPDDTNFGDTDLEELARRVREEDGKDDEPSDLEDDGFSSKEGEKDEKESKEKKKPEKDKKEKSDKKEDDKKKKEAEKRKKDPPMRSNLTS